MPELPEVETSCRALRPLTVGQQVAQVIVRNPSLRWPVSPELSKSLPGFCIDDLQRRAKYLLFHTEPGTLLIHLGMSGSLRFIPSDLPPEKHDHVDVAFTNGQSLRLRDPRRFGALLWLSGNPESHPLLAKLGPEPLTGSAAELAEHLFRLSRGRKLAVKNFIMDGHVVVGVGNIYASESLFLAGVRPTTAAGRVSQKKWALIAHAIRRVLAKAIEAGGTTLRDFRQSDGSPGYFAQQLTVYGRGGEPCGVCGTPIKELRLGQRSSFYCAKCQS